ncbi:MAG TPA: flagellar protein FlaG [Telluria sp.]|nr:flagellar protein FlaG [Telluria sp.]
MEIRPHLNTVPAPAPQADKPASLAAVTARAEAAPTQTVIAAQQPNAPAGEDQVAHALKSINQVLQDRSQDLEFSVDADSTRTIVKVVDKNTQEVIRQMPTQEALEIAKALDRLQSLLIKQQA